MLPSLTARLIKAVWDNESSPPLKHMLHLNSADTTENSRATLDRGGTNCSGTGQAGPEQEGQEPINRPESQLNGPL